MIPDDLTEWDTYYAGQSAPPGPVHPVLGRGISRWWRKSPHLEANGGDHSLDTPLCYEVNRLAAPVAPPDSEYDRLLARWFGQGWESR